MSTRFAEASGKNIRTDLDIISGRPYTNVYALLDMAKGGDEDEIENLMADSGTEFTTVADDANIAVERTNDEETIGKRNY